MAEQELKYGAGLRTRRTDLYSNLPEMGVKGIRPGLADATVERQRALDRITGLGASTAPRLQPPPGNTGIAQGSGVYYNPGQDRFSAGGVEFGREDYDVALQTRGAIGQPAPAPEGPGWQSRSSAEYNRYLDSISEGRGFLGNVGMGFRDVGEGVVGGIGRGAQMLGAEGVGGALVGAGEFLGPSAADDARDAMIRERQGLGGQILTAASRSLPTVGLAIAGGVGGGALAAGGLRAAAAGGAAARAGQLGGVFATIFPMEVQSSYTAAQQGGYGVEDPEVQSDIWATALTKTVAQTLPEAFLAGAFSRAFGTALRDASKRTLRNTVGPIVGVGSAEAAAETFATLADRVMFDPELRDQLNERDWAALAPTLFSKYKDEAIVAAGAGFLLGGGFRAAVMPFEGGRAPTTEKTPTPNRDLTGTEPADVLSGGTVQGAPTPPPTDTGPIITPPPGAMPIPGMPEEPKSKLALWTQESDKMVTDAIRQANPNVLDKITELHAQDLTAEEVATKVGMDADTVRSLRRGLGLPEQGKGSGTISGITIPGDIDERQKFEAWRAKYNKSKMPASQSSLSSEAAVAAAEPVITPAPAPVAEGPVEQATLILQRRMDLPPGAQRLSQRPSERAETYAPAPAPLAETAMGAQMRAQQDLLAQQVQQRQAAQDEAVARTRQEAAQRTQREDQLLRSRDEQRALQADAETIGGLILGDQYNLLTDAAKADWQAEVAAVGPEVRADVATALGIAEFDPEVEITDPTFRQAYTKLVADAEKVRKRQSNKLRRQAAEPPTIIEPAVAPSALPEGVFGTAKGQPFKNKVAAQLQRKRVASRENVPADRLDAVELPGKTGWGLQVRPEAVPPAPPKGDKLKQRTQDAPKKQGAKESALRKGPKAGKGVRGEDTQGQEAAGARVEETAQEPTPARKPEVKFSRGMTDAERARLKAAEAAAVNLKAERAPATRSKEEAEAAKEAEAAALQTKKDAETQKMEAAKEAAAALEAKKKADAEAAKNAPKAKGTRAPPEPKKEAAAALKAELVDLVANAKDVLMNESRTKRTLLNQAELDAGLELLTLSDNADPEVAALADGALEANATARQYKQVGEYRARADAHRTLGGSTTDADFAAKELKTMVDAWNSGAVPDNSRAMLQTRFKELAVRVRRADPKNSVLGYATVRNTPNTRMGQIATTVETGKFSLATLADAVLANGKRATPLPAGKQRMIARNFLSKFKVKPKLSVFKDQADLQQRNPDLYNRAVAARTQGDFDTAPAAGYFFDGEVIVFSDRIATREQLEFVMAHEVLGHYGMRAVASNADFTALMDTIYTDSSPDMKQAIDNAVAAREMSRAEATEEYLSDFAARVEMSLLRKWWAKAKSWLNAVGFKFDDDVARYMMNQSRRYLRTGETGSVFNTDRVAAGLTRLDAGTDPTGTGRFSTQSATGTIRSMGHIIDNPVSAEPDSMMDAQDRIDSAMKTLKLGMADIRNSYDKVKQNLVTPTIFRAMRSEGGQLVYNLLLKRTNTARSVVTRMQTMRKAALQPRIERLAGIGFSGKGISVEGREKAGYVLKANRMVQTFNFRAPSTKNLPKLYLRDPVTGKLNPVKGIFENLLKQNRLSRAEWAKGVKVPYNTPETMTAAKRAELTAARDAELAKATTDKAKNAITKKYAARIDSNTYNAVAYLDVQQTFTDVEWEAFNQELDAMAHTAQAVLEAKLTKYDEEVSTTYRRLQKAMAAAMTDSDRALMDRAVRRYVEIQDANLATFENGTIDPSTRDAESAEKFLIQFNSALLGKGRDRIYDLFTPNDKNNGIAAFPESEKQAIIDMIDGLRTRYNPPENTPGSPSSVKEARMAVQREVGFIAGQLSDTIDAEKAAVRTILTGYVPIVREGEYSAGMEFRDKDGKKFQLMEAYREQAPYMQFAKESQSITAAEQLTDLFGGQTYTVEVWDADADGGKGKAVMKEGTLTGISGAVVNAASTDPELSHDATLRFIRRFNIPLTPQKLEQIVIASTSAGNNAILRQLKTGFTPGATNDLTSAISQHIESRASTIARDKTSVALADAMDFSGDGRALWLGDQAKYDRLKAEYEQLKAEPTPNEDAISIARQEFEEYHNQFVTEDAPNKGAAKYNEARKWVDFLDQQKGVLETDLANNKHIAMVQMLTSISYLGMMVASAGLNVSSMGTNVPAALGTVNHKTGFGGGFGMMRASTTLTKMIKSAGFGGQNDTAEFWKGLTDAQLKAKGISRAAADFISEGINSGIFQAAQTNSLMGSARGRITSGGAQKFLLTFMGPFNITEQLSRRATGLAAFELMFQRNLAAGKSREAAAEAAAEFSADLVLKTLGDYTAGGRPALFRGGPLQFAFMFKMFTVNTAALIANLPLKGQVVMLGSLWLLSGLRGVPYAEDIEDLVNTLAQKFGIPMPSIRDSIRRTGDGLLPGLGETLVSGALNKLVPYDVGGRFSAGDIAPGTGMFLAGADVQREFFQIGGPMASWTQQAVGTIGSIIDAIVPGGKAPSLTSILRESPVTFGRALGDAVAYEQYGAIVDKRGYTVSNDYNSAIAIGRILGLYPGSASRAYESVRESKLIVEYQKSMTSYYRDRIVAAQVQGDRAKVADLYDEVREWNRSAKGTGLEVVNIRDRVSKALRAQRLSATARFLKTTPLSSRDAAQRIVDVYTAN